MARMKDILSQYKRDKSTQFFADLDKFDIDKLIDDTKLFSRDEVTRLATMVDANLDDSVIRLDEEVQRASLKGAGWEAYNVLKSFIGRNTESETLICSKNLYMKKIIENPKFKPLDEDKILKALKGIRSEADAQEFLQNFVAQMTVAGLQGSTYLQVNYLKRSTTKQKYNYNQKELKERIGSAYRQMENSVDFKIDTRYKFPVSSPFGCDAEVLSNYLSSTNRIDGYVAGIEQASGKKQKK